MCIRDSIFLSACTKRVMLMARMFIDDDTRACFENLWSVAGRRGCLLFIVNHGDDHCELFHDHQYKFNRMFVMMMMISDWCTFYMYYKLHCGSCWEGSMFINMNRAVAECSSIPIGHPHTSSIAPAIWCQNSHFLLDSLNTDLTVGFSSPLFLLYLLLHSVCD